MGHHLPHGLQRKKTKKKQKGPMRREMEVQYGFQDLHMVWPVGALKALQKYLHFRLSGEIFLIAN